MRRSRRAAAAAIALLAGCVPPPAPEPVAAPTPTSTPAPPPPPQPAPPRIPSLVGVRGAGATLELVELDATSADPPRVLHTLTGARASPVVFDVAVDAATGRYAVAALTEEVDDARSPARRDVTTLVLGDLDDGPIATVSGDPSCVQHRCFETALWLAAGGDAVVTATRRARGAELVRYAFAADAAPASVTDDVDGYPRGGAVAPAIAGDLRRLAYVHQGRLYVAELASGRAARLDVEVTGEAPALALADDRVLWWTRHADGARVAWLRRGDAAAREVRLDADGAGTLDRAPPLLVRGGRDTLVTLDGTRAVAIELADGEARDVHDGVSELHDVSADGRWLAVTERTGDDAAIAIVDLVDGGVAARRALAPRERLTRLRFGP